MINCNIGSFSFRVDETCEDCAEALQALKAEQERVITALPRLGQGREFILRPDRNSAGRVTHWHLDMDD